MIENLPWEYILPVVAALLVEYVLPKTDKVGSNSIVDIVLALLGKLVGSGKKL